MKVTITALSVAILFAAVISCKKANVNNAPAAPSGGKGGTTLIKVIPEHHGQLVDSCIVYIKYATNDAPVNGVYDDSAVCYLNDTTPIAIFTGLKTGTYYLYGKGVHPGYAPPYVKGGIPCTATKDADSLVVYLPTYSYNL